MTARAGLAAIVVGIGIGLAVGALAAHLRNIDIIVCDIHERLTKIMGDYE